MKLAALLLAGGESRRMGRDKSTLILDGRPLWQRQLDLLRQLTPVELLVSARHKPAWLPPDVRFVPDAASSRGPLGGLAAALHAMDATHLLALAIDLPAMTAAHMASLWSSAEPGCGVLPWLADRAEPLPAIYPLEGAPAADRLLSGDDFSLRAFAGALIDAGLLKKRIIGSSEALYYANCNTRAEFEHLVSSATFP